MASTPFVLAGVMGWPVAHTRSPVIHNHWIAHHGLKGAYVQLPVQPDHLEKALRGLPALGFAGCNVTVPHKVAVMKWVDSMHPVVHRIGAVNTIVVNSDGSLHGMNTDGNGYIQSLKDAYPTWRADAGPVLILGAGGAARAIVVALLDEGAPEIRLCNRNTERADELAQAVGSALVQVIPWSDRNDTMAGVALMVNTTTQGMHGQAPLDVVLDRLPKSALVSDVVYIPLETSLLEAARLRGNRTVNGLGMLLNQARPAFNAWFGIMPKLTPALLTAVKATL